MPRSTLILISIHRRMSKLPRATPGQEADEERVCHQRKASQDEHVLCIERAIYPTRDRMTIGNDGVRHGQPGVDGLEETRGRLNGEYSLAGG